MRARTEWTPEELLKHSRDWAAAIVTEAQCDAALIDPLAAQIKSAAQDIQALEERMQTPAWRLAESLRQRVYEAKVACETSVGSASREKLGELRGLLRLGIAHGSFQKQEAQQIMEYLRLLKPENFVEEPYDILRGSPDGCAASLCRRPDLSNSNNSNASRAERNRSGAPAVHGSHIRLSFAPISIFACAAAARPAARRGGRHRYTRPCVCVEERHQMRRDETRARCPYMPVAQVRLVMHMETLRHDDMQVFLRARHRHVKQPSFFVDFLIAAGAEIGRNAAVNPVQHKHVAPFLPLRGMDRRQDQIVFVDQRHARFAAGGIGRIERQFGQNRSRAG